MVRRILLSLVVFMSIALSAVDFNALVLRKLFSSEAMQPTGEVIRKLPEGLQDVVYMALSEGREPGKREGRIRAELLARGEMVVLERLNIVDPGQDLGEVELPGWKVEGWGSVFEPLPEKSYLMEGVFQRPSLNFVFSGPKSLKSLLMQYACVGIGAGLTVFEGVGGSGGFKTTRAKCLWLDLENGRARVQERFAALGKGRGLKAGDVWLDFVTMPEPWPDLSSPDTLGLLGKAIEESRAGMVVLDHFSTAIGEIDENSVQVSAVMKNLRGITEFFNVCFVVIHHSVKNSSRFGMSSAESLRGHGSLLANLDLALYIERNPPTSPKVLVKPVAVRGAPFDSFSAEFAFEHKPDGFKTLDTARFFGVEVESLAGQVEEAIIAALEAEGELNQTALRSAVAEEVTGAGDPLIRKSIVRLEKTGRLIVEKGRQNAKIYRLKE